MLNKTTEQGTERKEEQKDWTRSKKKRTTWTPAFLCRLKSREENKVYCLERGGRRHVEALKQRR